MLGGERPGVRKSKYCVEPSRFVYVPTRMVKPMLSPRLSLASLSLFSRRASAGRLEALLLLLVLAAAGCGGAEDPEGAALERMAEQVAAAQEAESKTASNASEEFVGCYAAEEGGAVRWRVTYADGQYLMAEKLEARPIRGDETMSYEALLAEEWSPARPAEVRPPRELAVLLDDDNVPKIQANLSGEVGTLLKTAPGTRLGGQTSETGYFAHINLVIPENQPLYPVSCP